MLSFLRVYHNVTRFCIAFNSQPRTGVIVNCLQCYTVQKETNGRFLNKNVVHSEVLKYQAVSSHSETVSVFESSASLQWAKMKVKKSKSKRDRSPATKENSFKKKAKKTSRKSKAESTKTMAKACSVFQQGDSSDCEVVIIYEGRRISKEKSVHTECLTVSDDDNCSANIVKLMSVEDIPLPQERRKEDVGPIPLPNDDQDILMEAAAQVQCTSSKTVFDILNQPAELSKAECEDVSPQHYEDSDTIHCYDYESEVMEETTRLQNIRKWENTMLGNVMGYSGNEGDDTEFTVMSYNVLAQQLLESHETLYKDHDCRSLTWRHRSRTLMNEFRTANADILCLQEVQEDHLPWYDSQLSQLGYEGLFKKRTNMHADGCAIYFKRHKFRLVECSRVEYYQPGVQVLNRDNVGLVARLEVIGTEGKQIVVATTHLLFNPRRHDVKLAQIQMLLTELERICYYRFDERSGEALYRPVILTGDLNLEPYSAVYRFLTDGFIDYSILSERTLQRTRYGSVQMTLLPPDLYVSNTCQHLDVIKHRQAWRHDSDEGLREELRLLKPFNSDNIAYLKKHESCNPNRSFREFVHNARRDGYVNNFAPNFHDSSDAASSSSVETTHMMQGLEPGMLSHCFHLKSVYKHKKGVSSQFSLREATTHQQDWVTVDYMFYSGRWNEHCQKTVEGPLKLLSRYGLPTQEQCRETIKHIPNMACGSDHLPLLARFLLRR